VADNYLPVISSDNHDSLLISDHSLLWHDANEMTEGLRVFL
jgi:hypothetical protein